MFPDNAVMCKRNKKKVIIPNKDSTPLETHTIRLKPTEPVSVNTPLGEIKIPEPVKIPDKHYMLQNKNVYNRQFKLTINVCETCMPP